MSLDFDPKAGNFYDVVIVGAGPAGIFTAYQLIKEKPNLEIMVIDKGRDIFNRYCPMREGKPCCNCKPCNIMHGFGGAGTYSDCKLSLSPHGVGGNIEDYVGGLQAERLCQQVEAIFASFDSNANTRTTIGIKTKELEEIEWKLKHMADLDLTWNPTKHLGTDGTLDVMVNIYKYLVDKGVYFAFDSEVESIEKTGDVFRFKVKNDMEVISQFAIVAPGRSGNKWLAKVARDLNINVSCNKFDIGYRVELPYEVLKELTDGFYDMKVSYTHPNGIKVRTFCTNPKGYVSEERYNDDLVLANGHSYTNMKSNNTNFAVLVTIPVENDKVVDELISGYTKYSGGKIIVNDLETMINGTNQINKFVTKPTLETAETYNKNVGNGLPTEINMYVLDFLQKLDKVYPGVYANSTNLYGIEAKFYSDLVDVKNNFETVISGMYCIGDGSGITRGIMQSACSGLVVANDIISRYDIR